VRYSRDAGVAACLQDLRGRIRDDEVIDVRIVEDEVVFDACLHTIEAAWGADAKFHGAT
jgi:hypothetical protein